MKRWYDDLIEDTIAERLALQYSLGTPRISTNEVKLENIAATLNELPAYTPIRGACAVYGKVEEFKWFSSPELSLHIQKMFAAENGKVFYGLHEVYRNKELDEHFIDIYVLPEKVKSAEEHTPDVSVSIVFRTKNGYEQK